MENVEGMEARVLEYEEIEEVFEDKDCEIFDTISSVSSIDMLKTNLKVLKNKVYMSKEFSIPISSCSVPNKP